MTDEHDPGKLLVVHRAPRGLLSASRRAAGTRGIAIGPLLGAAAGLLVGGLGMWGAAPREYTSRSGSASGSASTEPARPGAAEPLRPASTRGPDGTELRPVALVYRADDAREVTVAGTFNGWDTDDARMQPMGDGLFRVVLWLPPGQYEYQFVVDGTRWTPDPLEARHRDDGFGSANSVLDL